jgi:hypothetical protein
MRIQWVWAATGLFAFAGCQNLGTPPSLPSMTRVPPPGAGSYQVPGNYYNGTQATGQVGPVTSASVPNVNFTASGNGSPVVTAGFTSSSLPAASGQPSTNSPLDPTGIVDASLQAVGQSVNAASSQLAPVVSSASFGDNAAPLPSTNATLQWQ